jgi:F-type H+-transporting ATPase subunit b
MMSREPVQRKSHASGAGRRAYRLLLAALLLAALAVAAPGVSAQDHAPAAAKAAQPHGAAKAADDHAAEDDHGEGWMPTVWKIANFVILVGVLVYFLRTPLMTYLNGRIGKVREDLVTAAQTREAATRALAEIDAKLKALPAELAALKQRGAEDIAAERVRIQETAEAERQRLLEHTRREIDMRFRVAKRELLELTANLAVGVASERIKKSITPEDQARMIDRYSAQLGRGEARQ